jgi:hypothetical protein
VEFDVQYFNKLFGAFPLLYDAEGLKVWESDSPARDALSATTRDERVGMVIWKRGLSSTSRFRDFWKIVMDDKSTLLLVEGSHNDVELTLAALSEWRPTGGGFVARDQEEALDSAAGRGN